MSSRQWIKIMTERFLRYLFVLYCLYISKGIAVLLLTLFGFTSFREDIMRIFLGRAEIGQEGLDDEADTVNHVKTGQ